MPRRRPRSKCARAGCGGDDSRCTAMADPSCARRIRQDAIRFTLLRAAGWCASGFQDVSSGSGGAYEGAVVGMTCGSGLVGTARPRVTRYRDR